VNLYAATVTNFMTTKNLSRVQYSHIETFINTLGLHLMEKRTIRLITSWQMKEGVQV